MVAYLRKPIYLLRDSDSPPLPQKYIQENRNKVIGKTFGQYFIFHFKKKFNYVTK